MGFFKKAEPTIIEPEPIEKLIADKILEQQDSVLTTINVLDELPSGISNWCRDILRMSGQTPSYVDADFARYLDLELDVIPGDIIIRRNRDVKINDIIEIGLKGDEYDVTSVRVLKINIKEGNFFVQRLLEPEIKGTVTFYSVICVVDVIKLGTPKWKQIISALELEYTKQEFFEWVERDINYIKSEENFYEKEKTLKRLVEHVQTIKALEI